MITENEINEILEYLDKNILIKEDVNTDRHYISSDNPIIQNEIYLGGLRFVIYRKFNHSFQISDEGKIVEKWLKRHNAILIKKNTPYVPPFFQENTGNDMWLKKHKSKQ